MWLVLCQDGDVEAQWLAKALRARTDRAVELVEAGALVHECRWEHRVGAAGVSTRLLVGGTTVDSDRVAAVLNRLSWLGTDGYVAASARDREYAAGEFYALALSWLQGLGPRVINRPTGVGLAGTWRAPAQWCVLARSVGLPIVPYETGGEEPVGVPREGDRLALVLDGEVVDADGVGEPELPAAVRTGLARLQRASGLDLIEACLAEGAAGVALRGVSFLPNLSRLGERTVDAVSDALARRGGAGR